MRSSTGPREFQPVEFKTRFPALDGIRALAVTLVFASHYGGNKHTAFVFRVFETFRVHGLVGVDLFFVLSGFLITGILYDTQSDSRFFSRFFARRSIRIFPVFYLACAVLLLLTPVFHYEWKVGHLAFPLYLGNFALAANPALERVSSPNHPGASAHLIHFWSLCVEEQFYLVWPIVVWYVRDRIRLIRLASALCFTALALRIAFVLTVAPQNNDPWMMHMLPFRMDGMLLGATLALLLRGPNADAWQRTCRWLFLFAAAFAIAVIIFSPEIGSPWFATIGLSAVALASAGLIGACLRTGSPAFRLFHLRPLRFLGKYSYGFYVYHLIWPGLWKYYVSQKIAAATHSSAIGNGVSILLGFFVTLLIAKWSYDFFEVRFLHLKKGYEYDSELIEHKHAFTTN